MSSSKKLSALLRQLTNEAILESVEQYFESEADERNRMSRDLKARYTVKEDDESEVDDQEKASTGIDREEIVPSGEDSSDSDSSDSEDDLPKVPPPTEEELLSPSYELIKDRVNLIRSGFSLKDETVDKNFREWIESLSEESTRALLLYMTALSQIIAGKMPAAEVVELSPPKNQSEPSKSEPSDSFDGSSKESSSAPQMTVSDDEGAVPIVVGEHAAVRRLINQVKSARR
jgi:hypothetical protein